VLCLPITEVTYSSSAYTYSSTTYQTTSAESAAATSSTASTGSTAASNAAGRVSCGKDGTGAVLYLDACNICGGSSTQAVTCPTVTAALATRAMPPPSSSSSSAVANAVSCTLIAALMVLVNL
jgi:hypothetical protein